MAKRAGKTDGVVTDEDMADVIRAVLPKAKQADMTAALLIERVWRARGRTIALDLPEIVDAKSVAEAQARVLVAVVQNRMSPRDGRDVSTIIEHRRRALDTVEYEARLAEIEERQGQADKIKDEFRAKFMQQ